MQLFQLIETPNKIYNDAGNKARADIYCLAEKLSFQPVKIIYNTSAANYFDRLKRKLRYLYDWKKCYSEITANSIVLLQHPINVTNNYILRKLKTKKNIKYISIIIDIEELRQFYFNKYYKKEFENTLNIADIIVVHNEKMLKFFLKKGFARDKIINIESFDYLQENNNTAEFEKSINFAGNLDIAKCGFIGQLKQLSKIRINLYGPNFNKDLLTTKNIKYHGVFPVNEIHKKINKGFGLVWDGNNIDTCSGYFGQYLKFNNPHKLSLYLSCGLPVIIWKQAAQAEFVKKYNVGLCVENLKEAENIIYNMNEVEYANLINSVNKIKSLLSSGYFTTKALKQALNLLIKQ